MAQKKSIVLGGATLCVALATGYVMQFGFELPSQSKSGSPATVQVSAITDTSAKADEPVAAAEMNALPSLPLDALTDAQLPDTPVEMAAVQDDAAPLPGPVLEQPQISPDCAIDMTATAAAGAMVDVSIKAPCNASERFTLHHNGMMVTEVIQPDGTATLSIPALSETAVFIAAFTNGEGGLAQTDVPSLPFYDRVVVQWRGQAGLQLHAREFGANYFDQGHIWHDAKGDIAEAAQGKGGFLTRIGNEDTPDALVAEIYSFPAGTTARNGDIALSVEAEVTVQNCNTDVEAQTLDMRDGGDLKVQDLTLAIPECGSVGDFLVLKNLIEDLKIASN